MKIKHITIIAAVFAAGLTGEVVAEEYDAIPIHTTTQYRLNATVNRTGHTDDYTFIKRANNQQGALTFERYKPERNAINNGKLYGFADYFMITTSIPVSSRFGNYTQRQRDEWTLVNFGVVNTATLSVGWSVTFYRTVTLSSFAFSVSSENLTATVQTITNRIPQLTASVRYRFNTLTLTSHKLVRRDYRHQHAEEALHNDYLVAGHNADNEKIVRCVVHTYGKGVISHSAWQATKLRRQISAELSKAENADMSVDGLCAWIVANYPNTPLPPTGKEIVALYRATLPQRPVDESPRGNEEES